MIGNGKSCKNAIRDTFPRSSMNAFVAFRVKRCIYNVDIGVWRIGRVFSQVIEMFGQTGFACPIYQNYGKAIAQKRFTPAGFYLSLGLKDVGLRLGARQEGGLQGD